MDYSSCLSKLWNNFHHARRQIRARPLLQRFRVLTFFAPTRELLKTSSHDINYVSPRVGYAQKPVNISVNSCKGSPKKEVQGGIGAEKLPFPKETWPRFGRDCNVWGSMPPNSSSWLPIRNWWWNALRNGEFFWGGVTVDHSAVIYASWKLCVSVWAGMPSSFLVAIIYTQTLTHSVSLVCRHVCMLGGAGCLVKLLCFFFFPSHVDVEFVWIESWVGRLRDFPSTWGAGLKPPSRFWNVLEQTTKTVPDPGMLLANWSDFWPHRK